MNKEEKINGIKIGDIIYSYEDPEDFWAALPGIKLMLEVQINNTKKST